MAENVTLGSFATLQNSSIIATLNANNAILETALEDCVSRSGETPNQMNANLDMNNQQIINLPAPSTINSPVRLIDLEQATTNGANPSFGLLGGNNVWTGINTFQSAVGIPSVDTLIPNAPMITDGQTSNVTQWQSLSPILQSVNPGMVIPVNVTVGNPTVLSINPTAPSGGGLSNPTNHYLKPNQAFQFASGTLPAGLSFGVTYYLTAANMTATTFTFSTTNNYGLTPSNTFTTEGATVVSSGSASNVTIRLSGQDVDIFIPPGAYFGGNSGGPQSNVNVTPSGISRIRYNGYGATFDTKISFGVTGGSLGCMLDPKTWSFPAFDFITTTPNDNFPAGVDALVTLSTTANAANYFPGLWISLFALNIQDSYQHPQSGPPNLQYQEFKRIKSVNTGTGVLTLDGPLKGNYLSTFPQLFTPTSVFNAPGNASIAPMHPAWDCDITVSGIRQYGESIASCARRFTYKDCVFQGYGNSPGQAAPSVAQHYAYKNCQFGPADNPGISFMEVDKMLGTLHIEDCWMPNNYRIQFTSPSVQICSISRLKGSSILGTPKRIKIEDSDIAQIQVGPLLGVTDTAEIHDSVIGYLEMQERLDDNTAGITPNNDMTLVPSWTFSNGTFTRNLTGLPGSQAMSWQIPGAKVYMTDAGNVFNYLQNMGAPFTILNTYMDGSGNFSFDTTLTAIPTRQTSHTATITIAAPGVITWAGHGLTAGTPVVFTTTGALPTGFTISKPYYVTNDGNLTVNTFALSTTVANSAAGTAITTTGSQSGTHTAFGNPLCFRPHPCARFTGSANSGCAPILDLNGAIDEPIFSRCKRAFVGKQNTESGNPKGFQQPNPKVWGNLISMTVKVLKAGTASGTLTITSPGFTQPNLALSNFSQVIDTTVAGKRVVTDTTTTGSAGADTIAAYADWLSGPLVFAWSTGVTLPNSPVVTFEILTDQGITRFSNMMGGPVASVAPSLWQYIDSGINQII